MSTFSLIVPLYRSEPNLPRLLSEIRRLAAEAPGPMELILVNDGSPDRCAEILAEELPRMDFPVRLVHLSRNFGAFPAIAAGMAHARGDFLAVLAADLQEPPELALEFWRRMQAGDADVVFGVRTQRADPWLSSLASNLFWAIYRRWVNPEIPAGGVDVFGCTKRVRDHVCRLNDAQTNLIALLFWVGFRRAFVPYQRLPRKEGRSAWTFAKKLRYSLNSIFSFTDLPLLVLQTAGIIGVLAALAGGAVVLAARIFGRIAVPGYTPIVLSIFFFGGLTIFAIGILGQYVWLALRKSQDRPDYIIDRICEFGPAPPAGDGQGSGRQTTA